MKRLQLDEQERRTLCEMGMLHPNARVRRRAQALIRLAQGTPRAQVARDFSVHLNSVRGWIWRWQEQGLVGLHEGTRSGRPSKLSPAASQALQQVALEEGGTVGHIMACMEERHMPLPACPHTVARWLKDMGFSYKRYRSSLKKSAMPRQWHASGSNSRL